MNTDEKPRIKAMELVMVMRRIVFLSVPTVRSLKEMPVMNETYDGMRGRIQGDRNDRIPARNAKVKDISCMKIF
jgi:hypothetical protein